MRPDGVEKIHTAAGVPSVPLGIHACTTTWLLPHHIWQCPQQAHNSLLCQLLMLHFLCYVQMGIYTGENVLGK